MGKRRSRKSEEPVDYSKRQACRFPWDGMTQQQLEELEHRHRQAQLLTARGYGAVLWGESTSGEIFDF